jgi:hypothetical protein
VTPRAPGRRWLRLAPLLLAAASAASGSGPTDGSRNDRMEQALLAERVTSQALASDDVLLLAMAARLKLGLGDQPGLTAPRGRSGADKSGVHPRSAAALLQRARDRAQGRADLLALLEDIAQERPRGIEQGPRLHTTVAPALGTHTYRESFRPDEPATVLIAGDGDSNLDLYVFDAAGRRICASEKLDDVEVCRWRPPASGAYTIHVVNRGRADNRYELRSN